MQTPSPSNASDPSPASQLQSLLDRARRELLDLSTRNRLLAVPVQSRTARLVQVHDERSSEVHRLLVDERKTLSFLPLQPPRLPPRLSDPARAPAPPAELDPPASEEDAAPPPIEDPIDPATGFPRRHTDVRLQTLLVPEILQRRLLDLSRDALTTLEETGVNVLYLALGQLKWFEPDEPDSPRHAPLLLVPVQLSRRSVGDRFQLRARDEDVEENLSLRTKLETDFRVSLPPFPDVESFDPTAYFRAIQETVAGEPTWEILPDAIVLGCFSFAKLLLYRDLAPEAWPAHQPLLAHPFLPALLAEGFPAADPSIPDSTHLDDLIPVERLDHIVDADASQTVAIEMVRQGRNLVLQGPPGTGKSQSITNIIATAVLDGKKVLFVAEKLAALEVVQRRLNREGLGDLCLELHSNKASKRAVLDEIGRTWRLGKPRDTDLSDTIAQLEARRSALNTHCTTLHTVHEPSGLTPYRVLGELIRLGGAAPSAATLDLAGAESWAPAERAFREALFKELGQRLLSIGPPSQHPWRGVRRPTLLPTDLPQIMARVADVSSRLHACRTRARAVAAALRAECPGHLADARRLGIRARHVLRAPPLDTAAIVSPLWDTARADLRDLILAGQCFFEASTATGSQVVESAWEKDFDTARSALAAHGQSFFRFLNGPYRDAIAALRGVARAPFASDFAARLALADHLVSGQRALRALRQGDALGAGAFGNLWRRERSNWSHFGAILDWADALHRDGLGADFRQCFATLPDPASIGPLVDALSADLEGFIPAIHTLVSELDLDLPEAFRADSPECIPFDTLETRLNACAAAPDTLSAWIQYAAQARQARELQLTPLVHALHTGVIPPGDASNAFLRSCHTRLLRELTRLHPDLARFDGTSHSRLVEEFRRLDRERLTLARYRVLATHHAALPPLHAGVGAVGIVAGELERKRGHRAVRQLLRDAGSVVQAIKPVFMMSPLSVAQFLAPGAVEFDLLVIDEASQVQPVDALGAIARCRQIVVVGDSRQLPPTRFFARVTGDDSEPQPDAGAAGLQDIESILGLCSARGLPGTMLRWHYRSRHHSLIAVSNREFYDDRLFIVPSPRPTDDSLGLQLQVVSDGVFDSGGTGTNHVEARAVCRAVLDHARRHPHLSLGVAAFSVRQQQAILDELELLRRENPATESFFNGHPDEPFFVKNLENVQGDERDIVFISIGYGRDPDGFLRMNFGPLGAEGGERRLNVLISRARRRCVVFSSIRAADIDLGRALGTGVKSLKAFLHFAETGHLDSAPLTPPDLPSPFESSVQAALSARGFHVHPHVGIAGFFIDLAVADPDQPGRYLLGIECDGASYREARSARDRDRLRHALLHDHGWSLHRLWITDWFQRSEEQLRITLATIENAQALAQSVSPSPHAPPTSSPAPGSIARDEPEEVPSTIPVLAADPYVVASLTPPTESEPQDLPAARMTEILYQIIEAEGPVHEDELVVRIRDFWRLPRAGARLQEAVARGIRALLVTRRCLREEGCLDLPDRPPRVRSREGLASPNLRKPDLLPASEIRAAILQLAEAAHGVRRRELPTAVARLLGFRTTPASLKSLVESQCARLESDGHLAAQGNLLLRSDPQASSPAPDSP